tara:strand:+ start:288 stop:626 length:339 start_codon:yes stop_codon:yes gene_type:complete
MISDHLESYRLEKDVKFNMLIDKTDFSDEAKDLISELHSRLLDLELKSCKSKIQDSEKTSLLHSSSDAPSYSSIKTKIKSRTYDMDKKKGFLDSVSLAEQKAKEFNRFFPNR